MRDLVKWWQKLVISLRNLKELISKLWKTSRTTTWILSRCASSLWQSFRQRLSSAILTLSTRNSTQNVTWNVYKLLFQRFGRKWALELAKAPRRPTQTPERRKTTLACLRMSSRRFRLTTIKTWVTCRTNFRGLLLSLTKSWWLGTSKSVSLRTWVKRTFKKDFNWSTLTSRRQESRWTSWMRGRQRREMF